MMSYLTEYQETSDNNDGSHCSSLLSSLDNDSQSDSSTEVPIGEDEWPPSDEDTIAKDYVEARLEDNNNNTEADNKQPVGTLKAKRPITDIGM
jgi:hypothetical protein